MIHSRIRPYNPVKKAPGVPKKPVFPNLRTKLHHGPLISHRQHVLCIGGPWTGCRIWLTVGQDGDVSTSVFSASGFRGRYVNDSFMSVKWMDVP